MPGGCLDSQGKEGCLVSRLLVLSGVHADYDLCSATSDGVNDFFHFINEIAILNDTKNWGKEVYKVEMGSYPQRGDGNGSDREATKP